MVLIRYFGIVRQYTNCKEETLDVKTLGDLLDALGKKYGKETVKATRASMLTLNGERIESLDRHLALPDGGTLGIHPVCCGG